MTLAAEAAPGLRSVHSLGDDERKSLVSEIYQRKSRFQREIGKDFADFDSPANAKELRSEIIRLLEAKGAPVPEGRLEQLHRHVGPELKKYGFDDGVNKVSS